MDLQAKHSRILLLGCIVFASFALTMAQPPGLTKPSSATCKVEKYKECYNLVHVCPKFCPETCHVNCVSCKPICGPAPPDSEEAGGAGDDKAGDQGKGDDDKGGKGGEGDDDKGGKGGKGDDDKGGKGGEGDDDKGGKGGKGDDDKGGKGGKGGGDDGGYTPTPAVPSPTPPTPTPAVPTPTPPTPTPAVPTPTPPTPTPAVPTPTPPTPTPAVPSPTPPTPTPPTPTPAVPSPTPPTSTPAVPNPTPPTPTPAVPSPTPPTPAVPSPTPPTPTPAVPSPTPPTPTPPMSPPFVPYPSPPDSEAAGGQRSRVKCNDYSSEECYGTEYYCPDACPNSCEVDCVRCRSVCKCDKPGSVCQDPRFIGGDGLTFYFHGKKDSNFCLISDPNLHVNAHFIGKRTPGRARDFTWVQSIAILFGTHRLYVGALKTATWDDSVDRISASFDGNHITLREVDGATWTSYRGIYPSVTVKRVNADTNNVEVEVEGLLKITARVVPITMEDSKIHGYDVKEDDCLAHLDLGFKFYDLSDNVDGVLGQTYRPTYVSRVKIGVHMPVMGGDREFQTTGIFEPDCAATKFTGNERSGGGRSKIELPEMNCASGLGGKGVVCKR